MDEDVVSIDQDLIKVLAADSRREILRLLKERQMTLTEMSERLSLKKATVSEHLKRLVGAGLIERREDERLWVYYQLTRSGKRVVNPGRTRFYLVVGVSVASAVVGIFLAYAFLSSPSGQPGFDGEDGLAFRLHDDEAAAGSPLFLRASLEGADASTVDAFLLTADQAAALREGEGPVHGTPLEMGAASTAFSAGTASEVAGMEEGSAIAERQGADTADDDHAFDASPGEVELFVPAALPPGTYFVYVRDADGRDNRGELAPVVIEPIQVVLERAEWYRGLDGEVRVRLSADGAPLDGLLSLAPAAGEDPQITAPVVAGSVTFSPAVLDAAVAGPHELRFLPDGGSLWLDLQRTLDVREPQVAVLPRVVAANAQQDVQILVLADTDAPVPVRVNGTDVPVTRDPDGSLHVTLAPRPVGTLHILVGRLSREELLVVPGYAPMLSIENDGRLLVHVADASGAPQAVDVAVDDAAVGAADANGELRFDRPLNGDHVLGVSGPDGAVERAFRVEGRTVSEPAQLQLAATPGEALERRIALEVSVTNDARAPAIGTLEVAVNGTLAATRAARVAPGGVATEQIEVHWPRSGTQGVSITWRAAWPPLTFPVVDATSGGESVDAAMGAPAATLVVEPTGPATFFDARVAAFAGKASGGAEGLPTTLVLDEGSAEDAAAPGFEVLPLLASLAAMAFLVRRRRR